MNGVTRYLYVFNAGGQLDYTRFRVYDPLDREFLSFFHSITIH